MENIEISNDTHVTLSKVAQEALLRDICGRPSIEACGVLLGYRDEADNWYVEKSIALPNVFDSPVYFEFAPEDLLAVELSYPGQTIGVYHSHPTGFDRASETDRKNMERINQEQHIPWIWLIISGPFNNAFTEHAKGIIPYDSIIAYHHYAKTGLQRIALVLDPV
jgi:[CysO sulfur-carrier protein]-S-L-cysteine hydrolase